MSDAAKYLDVVRVPGFLPVDGSDQSPGHARVRPPPFSMPVEVAHYGLRRRASKKEFVPPNGSFLKQVNWSKCAEEALPIDLSEGFNFDDAVKGGARGRSSGCDSFNTDAEVPGC